MPSSSELTAVVGFRSKHACLHTGAASGSARMGRERYGWQALAWPAFFCSRAIRGHAGDKHNDNSYAKAWLRVQSYLQPQ